MLQQLKTDLKSLADPQKAKDLMRFFKTGKGEYGEGDVFHGVMVPEQRKLAKKYSNLPLSDIKKLLYSKYHEERLVGLLILTTQYQKGDRQTKEKLCEFYLKNRQQVNNWDLVDLTCHKILGDYLLDKDRSMLYKLANSNILWDRRIAVITTFAFIAKKDFDVSLKLAEILLTDKHDLMHKAVGWMLREIGNRDIKAEEDFLKKHYKNMPRTMLRYAIEKFPESKRQFYMKK